jgi:hypothetical protein
MYCVHCFVYQEILAPPVTGYPPRITDYDPDAGKPCRWLIYKEPTGIPIEFLERTASE